MMWQVGEYVFIWSLPIIYFVTVWVCTKVYNKKY
jgi:hypothetical protein